MCEYSSEIIQILPPIQHNIAVWAVITIFTCLNFICVAVVNRRSTLRQHFLICTLETGSSFNVSTILFFAVLERLYGSDRNSNKSRYLKNKQENDTCALVTGME